MLGQLPTQLWVATTHGDTSHLTSLAGQYALLMGEVVILYIASHLLERAACILSFCFV